MAAGRRNAFLRGFGGMFSFIDVLNRRLFAETAAEADAEAIHGYWEAVGGYLYGAIGNYSAQYRVYPTGREEETCLTTADDQNPISE